MAQPKGTRGKGKTYNSRAVLDTSQVQDTRRNNVQKRQGNAAAKDKRRTVGR